MSSTNHIFISYARRDGNAIANRLDQALKSDGYMTWRDTRDIDPAQDFSAEIEIGIENASFIAVCVTPESKRPDGFVRREIQYALALNKPVIPLRFSEIVPHVQIVTNEWVDFFKDWDKAYTRFREIISQPITSANIATKARQSETEDVLRPYLESLYQTLVRYLDKTVFSLVTLTGEATPDAVRSRESNDGAQVRSVVPMAFFEMAGITSAVLPNESKIRYRDFEQAFTSHHGRVLLLGEPGGGKTTTLFAFARDAVVRRLDDPSLPVPIIVPVATWDADKRPSLQVWLESAVPALSTLQLKALLDQNQALLLLDGLDELGKPREDPITKQQYDPRQRFVEMLAENQGEALSQVVVTCRTKDYAEIGDKLTLSGAVTLQPLDDGQMREYLSRMPDLWEALSTDHALREVARTPLLLSLFAFAFSGLSHEAQKLRDLSQGDLRDRIFEIYVHRRYERETRKPNAQIPFTELELYDILGRAAMHNVSKSGGTENLLRPEDFAETLRKNQLESFLEFAARLNLLTMPDSTLDVGVVQTIRFAHLLIRDYFAYGFAIETLGEPRRRYRSRAARALGKLRDSRAIAVLVTMMEDDNPVIRLNAVDALGMIGGSDIIEALIAALNDPDVAVQLSAAGELRRIGSPEALEAVKVWRIRQS